MGGCALGSVHCSPSCTGDGHCHAHGAPVHVRPNRNPAGPCYRRRLACPGPGGPPAALGRGRRMRRAPKSIPRPSPQYQQADLAHWGNLACTCRGRRPWPVESRIPPAPGRGATRAPARANCRAVCAYQNKAGVALGVGFNSDCNCRMIMIMILIIATLH